MPDAQTTVSMHCTVLWRWVGCKLMKRWPLHASDRCLFAALISINIVTPHWAQLVPGWVTS